MALNFPLLWLSALVVGPVLGWLTFWMIYVLALRPEVRRWFDEFDGYRRDHTAIRRRRDFEGRCGWAAKLLYGCWLVGLARVMRGDLLPDLSWLFWSAQLAAFLLSVLCAWAAWARLRTPDED